MKATRVYSRGGRRAHLLLVTGWELARRYDAAAACGATVYPERWLGIDTHDDVEQAERLPLCALCAQWAAYL